MFLATECATPQSPESSFKMGVGICCNYFPAQVVPWMHYSLLMEKRVLVTIDSFIGHLKLEIMFGHLR